MPGPALRQPLGEQQHPPGPRVGERQPGGARQPAEGRGVGRFKGGGQQVRTHDRGGEIVGGRAVRDGDEDRLPLARVRGDLERRLRDHAGRPQRADEEFREIVPGDVLDDLAPGLDHLSGRQRDPDADHHVADRAVQQPPRAVPVGGDDPANRGDRHSRGIDREPLAVLAELRLQIPEARSGAHRHDIIGGLVVGDPGEARRVDDEVGAGRHAAQVLVRSRAAGQNAGALFARGGEQGGGFLGRGRPGHRGGADAVNGIRDQGRGIVEQVLRPHNLPRPAGEGGGHARGVPPARPPSAAA